MMTQFQKSRLMIESERPEGGARFRSTLECCALSTCGSPDNTLIIAKKAHLAHGLFIMGKKDPQPT